LKRFNRCRIEM
jgi:hypothetical protein